MEILRAETINYEIEKILGEGLTGEVYKAFRVDSRGQTRQAVALKVLKSRTPVHIFTQEFQRLQKIDSIYCVKLLGWENFASGPALVLEFLEGMTLYDFLQKERVEIKIVEEIMAQVELGLRDLHQAGVVHGDLNTKNIFLTNQGQVKLLDFGGMGDREEVLATPQFMSPELWEGERAVRESDLFSLGLLDIDLRSNKVLLQNDNEYWHQRCEGVLNKSSLLMEEKGERQFLGYQSESFWRNKLGIKISQYQQKPQMITQVFRRDQSQALLPIKKWFFVASFILFAFYPQLEADLGSHYQLSIRSDKWLGISINGLPLQYAPLRIENMRPGRYQIQWKSGQQRGSQVIDIYKDSLFSLQLGDILLR